MDPLLKFYHPPPIDTVSIPVNGMFIKNTGCRTKFRANLVYQCLSSDFSGFWSLTFSTRELPRRIRAKGGPRPVVLGVEPQLETGERVGESLGEEA